MIPEIVGKYFLLSQGCLSLVSKWVFGDIVLQPAVLPVAASGATPSNYVTIQQTEKRWK